MSLVDEGEIIEIFSGLEKKIVRARVLAGEPRIDGREKRHGTCFRYSYRFITTYTWLLRYLLVAETQALVTATLGTRT